MVASTNETSSPLLALSNNLADAVERVGGSVVAVHGRNRVPSSGVHWRQGIIVTADHTLDREDGITVTLPDGRSETATLAGRDPGTDLAVLKINSTDLPVAEIAPSEALKVGHLVVAVARPGEVGLSATMGALSSISGPWRTWAGGQIDQVVRPDLTMYPGFSGGPLVNAQGQVVGINTSGLSRAMSLAIPGPTVNRVVEQLLTRGRIARGYLGLGMQRVHIPESLQQAAGLSEDGGLIVVSVESGGPAEKAGILVGDILVSLDGRRVAQTEDVQSALGSDRVGQAIAVQLIRGGTPVELQATVGERPQRGS